MKKYFIFFVLLLFTAFFQNCSEIKINNGSQIDELTEAPRAPVGEWDLCPKTNFYMSDDFYPTTNSNTNTSGIGPMVNGTTMVIKFKVPLDRTRTETAFFSTSYSDDAIRNWSVSHTACDFTAANAVIYQGKPLAGRTNSDLTFSYQYGAPGSGATLIQGETYYLNIFVVSDCNSSDCFFGPLNFK